MTNDSYTFLDANGRNVGDPKYGTPIGRITTETIQPGNQTTTAPPIKQLVGKPTIIKKKKNKKLKSLDKWNQEVRSRHAAALKPQLNGIACPTCGDELIDTNPGEYMSMWMSTTTNVHCSDLNCGYRGVREA
jgi:hypothetical protein